MTTNTAKWTEERTQTLIEAVGDDTPVSPDKVASVAEIMGTTVRSIAAKLRKLGYDVASMAKSTKSAFDEDETEELKDFVENNPKGYTYAEIAENVCEGKFTARQVQGKLLSLELTNLVKPTEKPEIVHQYTAEEEKKFIQLCEAGAYVEEIAEALNKSINSVRGKALSLLRGEQIAKIPSQKQSYSKEKEDVFASLKDISAMTVEEIAEATKKTVRGVKTMLTRRGITCADYDGAAKKAKTAKKDGSDDE